jgi:hypothetical protein
MPDSNPDEDDDSKFDSKKTGKAKPNDKQSARKPDRM